MTTDINLSKLLSESVDPMAQFKTEVKKYAKKWGETGLLEGLKSDRERTSMAILLESQARQLINENSKTGTSTSAEQWSGVALPLVRKVFAEIAAKEFVSVQPMNLPSGLVFYLDFTYGTAVAPRLIGQSVYGDTTSSNAPAGGLYGAGRFGYSVNSVTASFPGTAVSASSAATSASTNWASNFNPSGTFVVKVPVTNLAGVDLLAVRAFVPSGSGFNNYFPQYTTLDALQANVSFLVDGLGTASLAQVTYEKQPTANSRGDFEDTAGSSIPPTGVDLNIPQIDISLRSIPIVAKTRKLKAVWTPELSQDLNAYHSIDAEAELTAILSEHVALEIDLEILEMLLLNAQTTGYWSAQIGTVWNGTAFQPDQNLASQAWTTMTWYQSLGVQMQKVSNKIHQLTLRGGANWAVVSPDVASIIESIPGFVANTDGNQASFAAGVTTIGGFKNRYQIYKNPYLTGNVMLMGFRGSNFLETGAVYAPYIPMIMTPLVYDPQNFTPRRGVLTRYAKEMVRPEFYGRILVEGLQPV